MIDFLLGFVVGGLLLSACWGWFWFAVGMLGFSRKTCSGRVVLNGLTVGLVPLVLMAAAIWWHGGVSGPAFGVGLSGVPLLMVGLSLRRAPDGQRAGAHMFAGVRHLMDELLGRHEGCGGCDHEHDHGSCA